MRQRVAVARALIRRPELLLLDEPYAGLDAIGKQLVDDVIVEASAEGRTVILATHDPAGGAMAVRTVRMEAGRILQEPKRQNDDISVIPLAASEGARVG